jgi:FkbM family methyltransferase
VYITDFSRQQDMLLVSNNKETTSRPMQNANDLVIVNIADLYLCYHQNDFTLEHILKDPRARIVIPEEVEPLPLHPVDIAALWNSSSYVQALNLLFIHFWRSGLDFTYLDIGANVGLVTIATALFFKSSGRSNPIIAFEPGPTFECLERAVVLNQVGDICTCSRLAVGDHSGQIAFHSFPANSSGNSTISAKADFLRQYESRVDIVGCTSIDDFVDRHGINSNLICKIDTEGADLSVIAGMESCMATRFTPMLFEFTPALVSTYVNPVARLVELSARFSLFEPHGVAFQEIPSRTSAIGEFVGRVSRSPEGYIDVVALPRELPNLDQLKSRLVTAVN